jgi:YVTN family beta-propeller protein
MRQAITKLLGVGCVVISLVFFVVSLSLVEGSNASNVATITVGGTPYGIAITPDSKYAYVANFENVSVIDTATNKLVETVATTKFTQGIVITPDGKYAYVTCSSSDQPIVSVISTATNTVVDTIAVAHTPNGGIAMTSDGKSVYLTSMDGWVMVINTETNKVTANITITPRNSDANVNGVTLTSFSDPDAVAISPDNAYAYVGTGSGDSRVIMIDASTNKIVNSITIGSDGIADIAIAPDGKHVYATSDDKIFIIDTATNTVTTTLTGFGSPMGIAITSDGKYAYTVNNWNDTVFILNTATNAVDRTVSVGQGPRGLAFTRDGKYAYVICDSSTALTDSPGASYVGTVWVISTGEAGASSQATPVAEFPVQFLAVVILVVIIIVSASFIVVKMKPWKKQSTNTEQMLAHPRF